MAELEPKEVVVVENAFEAPVTEVVVVDEQWNIIPPNRPRKVYAGMWGPPEIGAVAAGSLALIMAFVAYFFWVVPSERELVKNRAEADRLETELITANQKYGTITDSRTQVTKIVESIDDFEARFLPVTANGQAALYQRLNGLIRAYDLVNTSGPDYVPLETIDSNQGSQGEEERGRAKFRSLYPGVYVTTSLEGSYQNLRRFIREVETGREFVIVSAVELVPAEGDKSRGNTGDRQQQPQNPAMVPINPATGMPGTTQPAAPAQQDSGRFKGKKHGETVTLRIEMAAYFRRPNVAAPVTQ
jgi:hypothetical protein